MPISRAASGGRLLLRIEDIDRTRCKPDYEQAIHDDLAWLGMAWEQPVRRQSEHFDAYRDALATPAGAGPRLCEFRKPRRHRSNWSRRAAIAGRAIRTARRFIPAAATSMSDAERKARMAAGEPYALRLDMAKAIARAGDLSWSEAGQGPAGETGDVAARPQAWGDVILARKDMPTSYHLSVVVDDALQGVTHVVRGQDLFWSTSVHRLLQALLGLPQPAYRHHRLILRCRRPQAVEIDTGDRAARAAGRWRNACRHPADDRPAGTVNGRAFGAVSCWRDRIMGRGTPKRKAVKRARKSARKRSAVSSSHRQALETALASLAHDIRTPLTGILALSELLIASDLPERERGWARAIRGAADHLAQQTSLVLDAVKADRAGLALRKDVFSPAATCRSDRSLALGARRRRAV